MSIRVKVLLILVLGMLVALCVSALAYFNAHALDRAINRILTQDMAALRAVSEARETLLEVRRLENLMVTWKDPRPSLADELERALEVLQRSVESGRAAAPDVETSDTYLRIDEDIESYMATVPTLVSLLTEGHAEVTRLTAALQGDVASARQALRQLQEEVVRTPLANGATFPEVAASDLLTLESQQSAIDAIERCRSALDVLAETGQDVTKLDSITAGLFPERLDRRLGSVRDHAGVVAQQLGQTRLGPATRPIEAAVTRLGDRSAELTASVSRLFDGVDATLGQTRRLRTDIEGELVGLSRNTWQSFERRRAGLGEQRSTTITVTFAVFLSGLALVILLGIVLMRGMTTNFEALVEAARDIQRGNLNARVRIRSRDELRELGNAFNAMARYLGDRRKRQADYNEIVSLLNSSLRIDEILGGALAETVERTGSAVGAFYSADESGEELLLAKSYGISDGMMKRRSYKLGAGLVGQAAKNRRKIFLSPVPEGAFDIDTGVGTLHPDTVLVLPVVHVDRLLGVFILVAARAYTDEMLTFIEEAVFQFGVALNNARFVEELGATARALEERSDELILQSAQLAEVNRHLEDANRLKSDFLASVTHELRTPLNSIIGFTELVLAKGGLEGKSKRHLDTVLRNAQSLLGLINDLLNITKIEAGKVTLQLGFVPVARLVDECLHTISPLVNTDRVALEARIDPALQQVFSDREKLKQILLNLLGNAAKFTEEGAIRVDARVLEEGWVEFAVIDTGIGIHAEDLPLIFDKFRQVDGSTSRKYGGTGLGLAITSELVRIFGGQITAKSEPNAGSTFIVHLPSTHETFLDATREGRREPRSVTTPFPQAPVRVVGASPQEPAGEPLVEEPRVALAPVATEPPAPGDLAEPGRGPLLVLDDAPDTVINLRNRLRNDGYEVKVAFVCADAVQMMAEQRPSALIVGRPLPEGDPDAAFARLHAQAAIHRVPLILLEGARTPEHVAIAGIVKRPIDPDAVLELLRSLPLEGSEAKRGAVPQA